MFILEQQYPIILVQLLCIMFQKIHTRARVSHNFSASFVYILCSNIHTIVHETGQKHTILIPIVLNLVSIVQKSEKKIIAVCFIASVDQTL